MHHCAHGLLLPITPPSVPQNQRRTNPCHSGYLAAERRLLKLRMTISWKGEPEESAAPGTDSSLCSRMTYG